MSEKWWDMSDDELDDLFRDASDKVDVPFESSSFDKLRRKIDIQRKPEPPQGYMNRWLVLLAGLFLIVGVGSVYYFVDKKQSLLADSKKTNSTEITGNIEQKNAVQPSNSVSSEKNKDEKIKQESTSLKSESVPSNLAISSERDRITEKSNPSLLTSPQSAKKIDIDKISINTNREIKETKVADSELLSVRNPKNHQTKVESEVESAGTENRASRNKISETTNLSPAETALAKENLINKGQIKESKSVYYKSDNQVVIGKNLKNSKLRKGKNNVANSEILGQNTSPIIENSVLIPEKIASKETVDRTNFYGVNDLKNKDSKSLLTEISTDLPPYIDSLPKVIKSPKLRHFGIRLALSPDINSIENLDYSALGGSVGLLFEYRISKKFALQTGISYSSKKYVGDFEYYHAWPDWTKGHPSKPTEVDGTCKVIDIPLNLRFNIFQKPRQTWFVSSGVSSYIMLNETYIYNYAWSPTKTSDWSDKSSFYFSTLNLSIGWEKQVSKHLSFQAEPYLKTPLKGVGRGLVNLYSSGILFSTKYQF